MKVNTELGLGLLENAYEACLYYELMQAGLLVSKQLPMPVVYHDFKLEAGYRIDLIVENKVIIEIQAVEAIHDLHFAQLLNYLKLSKCKLGLLINFNVKSLKFGIRRVVNGLSKKTLHPVQLQLCFQNRVMPGSYYNRLRKSLIQWWLMDDSITP